MSQLSSNRLWETGVESSPSQYTRMIPGTPALPSPRFAPPEIKKKKRNARHVHRPGLAANENIRIQPERKALTSPAIDNMSFELLAWDSVALAVALAATTSLIPGVVPWNFLPIMVALVILLGFCEGVYTNGNAPYAAGIIPALFRSTLFASGLVYIAQLGFKTCITIFSSAFVGLTFVRCVLHHFWKRNDQGAVARKALIVGGGMVARTLAQSLRNDAVRRTTVCGFLDEDLPLSPVVLGRIADLDWLARSLFIDEVILALPGQPALARLAAELAFRNHLDILAVPDLPPGPWPGSSIDRIGDIGVITLHREPLPGAALSLKRFLDIVGSIFALAILSPLMATIAALIRLDSPGPAIYSAERTGAKGHPFQCLKFRSMVTNADHLKDDLRARNQRNGPIFKIDNDPRITRIGNFIRKYSLDELPQLWNVLKGEMSLVGPRPHPVDEVNHYELQHYRRLDVKPGITGLWQITARDCPSFELNMHLDLTYIENWSVLLDLRILAKTVHVLFAPEGA